MKALPALGFVVGCALVTIGVHGAVRGAIWLAAPPSVPRYDYNEGAYAAWGVASIGLLLLGVSGFILGRLRCAPWFVPAATAMGALLVSEIVGLLYHAMVALAVLGNDSRSWNSMRDQFPGVILNWQAVGALVGIIFGLIWLRRGPSTSRN